MTICVYKNGVLASDSQVVDICGNKVARVFKIKTNWTKDSKGKDMLEAFAFSGDTASVEILFKALKESKDKGGFKERIADFPDDTVSCIYANSLGFHCVNFDGKWAVVEADSLCIGSGSPIAQGFLQSKDATAIQAVIETCKISDHCSPPVQWIHLDPLHLHFGQVLTSDETFERKNYELKRLMGRSIPVVTTANFEEDKPYGE